MKQIKTKYRQSLILIYVLISILQIDLDHSLQINTYKELIP